MHNTIEERMMEIEIKLTRQEDLLDALNQTVYQQQKEISALHQLTQEMARQLRDMQFRQEGAGNTPAQEKPPHY